MSAKKIHISFILLLVLFLLVGSPILQLGYIATLGILFMVLKNRFYSDERTFFYLALIIISLSQVLYLWHPEYSRNYIVNTLVATVFWGICLLTHVMLKTAAHTFTKQGLYKLLNVIFYLNIALIGIQYLISCYVTKSLIPFMSGVKGYGMSTGDHLMGFFSNSSVSMTVMAFYTIYYLYQKDKKYILAGLAMLASTYMSGILLFLIISALYAFFVLPTALKIRVLLVVILLPFIFLVSTPENVEYVKEITTEKIHSKADPPRKLVSFKLTALNFVSSPKSFLIGEGAGKFSSRASFLTGGDYVDWFPKEFVFRSEKFQDNHFSLWNKKVLSIPFRDGTHNQPFSFYNQIIGEFGLLGIILFGVYIGFVVRRWHLLTYGKLITLLLLAFLFLDYWFDYFSIILFFELFINLNLKESAAEQE